MVGGDRRERVALLALLHRVVTGLIELANARKALAGHVPQRQQTRGRRVELVRLLEQLVLLLQGVDAVLEALEQLALADARALRVQAVALAADAQLLVLRGRREALRVVLRGVKAVVRVRGRRVEAQQRHAVGRRGLHLAALHKRVLLLDGRRAGEARVQKPVHLDARGRADAAAERAAGRRQLREVVARVILARLLAVHVRVLPREQRPQRRQHHRRCLPELHLSLCVSVVKNCSAASRTVYFGRSDGRSAPVSAACVCLFLFDLQEPKATRCYVSPRAQEQKWRVLRLVGRR